VQCADEQGLPVDLGVVDAVERAAASVFDADAPLAEGAREVLSHLAGVADLALLTKGDRDVQATRIVASGLAHLFGDVVIVPEKSPATFRHVVERMGAEAASSWSVGNSLASDVHPAMAAGMRAVWVDAYVWPHERRERTPAGDVMTASSLREAGRLVTAAHPVPAPAGRGGGRATLAAALPGDR
jgi:putative hydrolase of the HAD superfamily